VRILSVIESLTWGGAERLLVYILPRLQSRGHVCEVAALFPPYFVAPALEESGIVVHRLNLAHRLNMVAAIAKIATLCHQGKFDILHGNLFYAVMYTAMSRPFAASQRRVVSFHNCDYDRYPSDTPLKRARKATHKWLMRHWIDGWAAVSQEVARHYQAHFGLQGIRVIYNAFPLDTLRPVAGLDVAAVRARYGVSAADFLLVTPARFVRHKGQRFALQALTLLRERGLRPKLLLLGQGPSAGQLSDMVKELGLQEQVIAHDPVPHGEVLRLIQAADALVLASLNEGFGIAAGEAMALEKPVLATRVEGLKELVEEGVSGLLVPPADPVALAEGIESLMCDPALRERLGRAGRERIETHFSADAVAGQWEKFYRSLLDDRGPPKA